MQKKVESKRKIREMKVSEKLSFPIEVLETVRNNVSLLNTKYYREGRKWSSVSNKEEGIVYVRRLT